MNEIGFWEKDAEKISAIIESIDGILGDSYLWVISLKEQQAWCSEKTKDYFGLSDRIFPQFEQITKQLVYPEDQEEYLKGITGRLAGMHLDEELCIRMREKRNLFAVQHSHKGAS